jgi:predicted nucleotidyltransferase component of viral defense system
MIDQTEVDDWARRFGVSPGQIRRDHFISHTLAALGRLHRDTRFFGGTALCRTHLPETRLSEDIDLLHAAPRKFLDALRRDLPRAIRREFPDASWSGTFDDGDGVSDFLGAPDVAPIKIYVGRDGANTRAWEFVGTQVALRYGDLPPTQAFACPTVATFAAMKLSAWFDRHAPRDLFDLDGLAAVGVFVDRDVERIFTAKMNFAIADVEFSRIPASTLEAWETELRAQVGTLPRAEDCLERVRAAVMARPRLA